MQSSFQPGLTCDGLGLSLGAEDGHSLCSCGLAKQVSFELNSCHASMRRSPSQIFAALCSACHCSTKSKTLLAIGHATCRRWRSGGFPSEIHQANRLCNFLIHFTPVCPSFPQCFSSPMHAVSSMSFRAFLAVIMASTMSMPLSLIYQLATSIMHA